MKELGFIILTWNSEKYILKCLESIKNILSDNISYETYIHIVVIDNGSSDNTCFAIEKFRHESHLHNKKISIDLIRLNCNIGTTKPRNIGFNRIMRDYPNTEYFCILDSDTEINQQAIYGMIDILDNNSHIGIVGPRMHDKEYIYQDSGRNTPTISEKILKVIPLNRAKRKGENLQNLIKSRGTGIVNVGYLMSACWMLKKRTIDACGLLDEKFFYAPEDADYCMTCWDKGLLIVYCYDVEILHHWQRLSRKKIISMHNYEHIKGLLYLFRKHGHAWKPYDVTNII